MKEIPDFVTAVAEKAANERKRYPCHSNRASSMGYFVPELEGCIRRGVYERTRWQEKELWEPESILRFREGDRQEQAVLRDLADVGVTVIEQQTPYEWKEHQITGHIDGKLLVDGEAIPLEIKSCSPNIWSTIHSYEDLDKKPWLRAYKAQITLYMLMQNCDRAVFIFKDKSSGLMKQINTVLDFSLGECCLLAAEKINKHVAEGTLPEGTDNRETCKRCPFKHLCLPEINFGEPLRIEDDPKFEERITNAMALKEAADEYKKEWEIVKEEAKASSNNGDLNLIVGRWHLTANAGKQFRLKVEEA